MAYTCHVCGYPELDYTPFGSHEICPSCGVQFGYDDTGLAEDSPERQTRIEQLRAAWLLGVGNNTKRKLSARAAEAQLRRAKIPVLSRAAARALASALPLALRREFLPGAKFPAREKTRRTTKTPEKRSARTRGKAKARAK
jgi:hypothetical protein